MTLLAGELRVEPSPAAQTGRGPARAGPAHHTDTHPLWYLRINPLRRDRLSDPVLRQVLGSLAVAQSALQTAAAQCSDDLYARIGTSADEQERRRLVAWRRLVHNDRAPRQDPSPSPAVDSWLAARQAREVLLHQLAEGYDAAADRERVTLAGLLGQQDLEQALALVAPEVHQESQRYQRTVLGEGIVSARVRKSERGLVQYVTRALVRTSPLSRFTAVGLAVPGRDGVAPERVTFTGARSFPSLDRVMLGFVLAGFDAAEDPRLETAWVGVPPTSGMAPDGSRLFFLAPSAAGLRRLAVPTTGLVGRLLAATVMGPRPAASVVADLARRSGSTTEQAWAALRQAVTTGILSSWPCAEDGDADLDTLLDSYDRRAGGRLRGVSARLGALAGGTPTERAEHVRALTADLAEVSHQANRLAEISVEEDYVVPPLRVDARTWEQPLQDLGAAAELLSAFDWLLDVRMLMSAAFVERYGRGADVALVDCADHLVAEVSRRALAMDAVYRRDGLAGAAALQGLGPADGSLEQVYRVRQQVTQALHARIGDAVGAGRPDVVLTPAEATDLTAGLPDRCRADPLMYGVLVQPWQGRLYLNDGLPGHGMLYARFLGADRELGGGALGLLAERLTACYGAGGRRVVEDLGLHRLNVNAHPQVLPDGLQPDDWFRLRVRHDPATDALVVHDDGVPLAVLPLGSGHPGLFPAPLSVATGLVISGRLYNTFPTSWHAASGWDGAQTRRLPRMSVGQVVVGRQRWYGGAELTSAVQAGPREHDRLAALTAWRTRHEVPEEVVIKSTPADEGPLAFQAPDGASRRLQHKPQYVDLASALGVRVLPRMLERRHGGEDLTDYVEEARPAVVQGSYATEWVVEISRAASGRLGYRDGTP